MVLIDNLALLKEMYFQDNDPLLEICGNGLGLGISVMATAQQTGLLSVKYLPCFQSRMLLSGTEDGKDYEMFGHKCEAPESFPGRCLIEIEKEVFQCQVFQAFPGETDAERMDAVRSYILEIEKNKSGRAIPIPAVPESLKTEELIRLSREQNRLVLGIEYSRVEPLGVDLEKIGVLALSGKNEEASAIWLKRLMTMSDSLYPGGAIYFVADHISRNLSECRPENRQTYTYLPTKAPEVVRQVELALEERYKPLLVLILNSKEVFDAISEDYAAQESYKNITGKYKNLRVCVILSECENLEVGYASGEVLNKWRNKPALLFFGNLSDLKMIMPAYDAKKTYAKPIRDGDAFFVQGDQTEKIRKIKIY